MKNQGGFASIIWAIVIAMVLMSGGAYVWLNSDIDKDAKKNTKIIESENSNTLSFAHEDFKYNLEYPKDWEIRDMYKGNIEILPPDNEAEENKYYSGPKITIWYVDDISDYGEYEETKININNLEVTKHITKNTTSIFLPRPEGGYIRVFWDNNHEDDYPEFQSIINSIVILEDDSPEWVEYIDTELGISFSYPRLKWGNLSVSYKKEDANNVRKKSGESKMLVFAKNDASIEAFSTDFDHMYVFYPYLGDKDLSSECIQDGIIYGDYDNSICKNINIDGQDTYDEILAAAYEGSFWNSRQVRLNLSNDNYAGLLISQRLPSSQSYGTPEESSNEERKIKDLTDQYHRENLEPGDSEDLKLMDKLLESFKFLDEDLDKSDWQTYTNNNLGISFEYQDNPNYHFIELAENQMSLTWEEPGPKQWPTFVMNILKTSSDPTEENQDIIYSRTKKRINNLLYREYWKQGPGDSYGYLLHDENSGDYYSFETKFGPENKIFEQIMKTVSLAKVIPSGPTADWQAYTNNIAGISFDYPSDFVYSQDSELFGELYKSEQGHFWVKIEDGRGLKTAEDIKTDYWANDTYGYGYEESFVDNREIYKQGRYDLGVIENYYSLNNDKLITISFEFNFDHQDEGLQESTKSLIADIIQSIRFLEPGGTTDAGKECTDSSQCESYCTTDLPEISLKHISENGPMEMTGNCSAEQVLTGCYSLVKNGFVDSVECAN